MASEVAALLRGKHKPIFAPHMDTGDHVIVINADGRRVTGGKEIKKVAYHHSGLPRRHQGHQLRRLLAERPVFVVEKAVRGMLPKNRLGRAMVRKLHVVEGPSTRTQAQQPVAYTLGQPPVWEGLPAPAPRAAKTRHLVEAEAARSRPKPRPRSRGRQAAATKPPAKKTTATKPPRRRPPPRRSPTAKKKTTAEDRRAKKTMPRRPNRGQGRDDEGNEE